MSSGDMYQCDGCGEVQTLPTNVKRTHGYGCPACNEVQDWTRVGINPDYRNVHSSYECVSCGNVEKFLPEWVRMSDGIHCSVCDEEREWNLCTKSGSTPSTSLLDEAKEVVEDRENRHGSIIETHQTIADFWSVYLTAITGHEIDLDASHAADMLDLFKDARKATGERDRDTYRDGVGYNHCAWTCREAELKDES